MTRNQKRSESPIAVFDGSGSDREFPDMDGSCFVKPEVTAPECPPLIPDMPLFLQLTEDGKHI